VAAIALFTFPGGGCGQDLAAERRRIEARVLSRQIENLREMKTALAEKRLVSEHWLAIAADETAVRAVIEAGLPQEMTVGGRFRVLVHRAEVSFSSGSHVVRLNARVTDTRSPDRFADVVYQGGLDDIVVAGGKLTTRVLIDDIDVPQVQTGGAPASLLTAAAGPLAGQNLERLQALIPPVAIPVKVEEKVAVPGFGDGPVEVDPAEVPLNVKVARVVPLSGRLWVFLDVSIGAWRKTAPPTPSPSPGKKP
jgi:hypothetical protein